MPETLKSWSFSRYSLYQQCPLKCKLIHIDKLKEPPSPALERGVRIHEIAENYIKGTLPEEPFPEELRLFRTEIKKLRKAYKIGDVSVEEQWGFTKDWKLTRWDDWANCWLRIKIDVATWGAKFTRLIKDWKTGKFRPDKNAEYIEQLELYSLGSMLAEESKSVKARLVYLDEGVVFPDPQGRKGEALGWTRADVPALQAKWEDRVRPMLADTIFAPRPNRFCGWCHFRKANGGPCQY